MFGRSILLGATAGILSGVACIVFEMVYRDTVFVDFSILISKGAYFGACIFGCVLASIGFWAATKFIPKYGEIIFNFLFALLTFASILGPIMYVWPLDMPDAQMELLAYFPMYAMTLHFFPIVVWFTLKPLFIKK
jgi:hypothetical protein